MRSGFLAAAAAALVFGLAAAQATADREHGGFDHRGDLLISDQFNNRAIEVDAQKQIVWSFGSGNPSLCNPGPGAIIGLNDAERLSDGLTLLAGTGIPPGASSFMPNGCVDNRVIVVDHAGKIVWQYGQAGVTGSGPNQLNVPVFAIQLPNHDFLIVDQGNNRVIEVNKQKQVVWSYGGTGVLNNPNSAELLPNGHILIADENNSRVIEITRSGKIAWQVGSEIGLNIVAFASRLPNGDTLITDSGNNRILKINKDKQPVFQYFTNTALNSNPNPLPTNAVQLRNGDISIADQFNNRALIINRDKETVFQYGMTNIIGNGPDQLDGPYTAFVVGDYTGQTPPPKDF